MNFYYKLLLFTSTILYWLIGCNYSTQNKLTTKSFKVESHSPEFYIDFKTPLDYLDIYEYFEDTTKLIKPEIAHLINKQSQMQNAYIFYDSITPTDFITVVSGERFILTEKPPKQSYFSQRSGRFYEIFPSPDSTRSILYEWRNKEYKDLRYHKTQYKIISNGITNYQAIYFIITPFQSAVVSTISKTDLNLDLYILNMEVILDRLK